MDINQLRVFAAVIEEGSFTRAASALYMTQSGVSRAVASLESELGLPLLVRSRGGVTATDAGERVLGHAREVLSEVELLKQDAAALAGLEIGRLRIGGFPSACARLLPGIIGEFERRYPGIEVVVSEGTDQKVTEWLHHHVLDVGFVHLPATRLHTVPIAVDRMLLALPPGHRLAQASSEIGISKVSSEPFILPRGRSEPIVASIFREAGIVPSVRFTLRDVSTVLSMVREGMGMSILAEMSLLPILSGVRVRPIAPTAERHIGLGIRSEDTVLPAARAFINLARTWTEFNGYLPV
ncbi:LysR family transcriptional regulator [soil metagenome]